MLITSSYTLTTFTIDKLTLFILASSMCIKKQKKTYGISKTFVCSPKSNHNEAKSTSNMSVLHNGNKVKKNSSQN